MQVFNAERSVQSPPRQPAQVTVVPPLPAKEPVAQADSGAPERTSRRAAAAAAARNGGTGGRRASGGGLTGQYSTSVPATGGYFPDMDKPNDEASMMRRDRQNQRDQKRRALKAAWGIDNREHNSCPMGHVKRLTCVLSRAV